MCNGSLLIMNTMPQFINTKPKGKDLYDGYSQERIAKAIAAHIKAVDACATPQQMPRIIGVEGEWGSGKSNVIEFLNKEVLSKDKETKYHFFTYDAWGHQEDLQRRSILELITRDLIDNGILRGKTKMLMFDHKLDKDPIVKPCEWPEKLQSLIAKKTYSRTVSRPSMHSSTKFFVLALLITGMMPSILDAIGLPKDFCWIWIMLLVLAPLLAFFIIMVCCCIWGNASFKEMWRMYNTSADNNETAYTISELEPSVKEFREWMQDISQGIDSKQKLVVVFDNMDRLPVEKVKTLWSSIHTFFAENGYPNIWCVIPFDRKHIAKVYGEEMDTTTHFINKTFPVVYRVPAPVISDYKSVFNKFWNMAFEGVDGINSDTGDIINRMYRKIHLSPNARCMITFINKVVSLYNMWHEEVSLEAIALFVLREQDILSNSENNILSGDYIKPLDGIIKDTESLRTEISTLVYGVSKDLSSQLPLKKYLQGCLISGECSKIVEYAQSNLKFFTILEEEINEINVDVIETASVCLKNLEDSEFAAKNYDVIRKCWNQLSIIYKENIIGENCFPAYIKYIIQYADKGFATMAATRFIDNIHANDELKGNALYEIYSEVDALMEANEVPLVNKPTKVLDAENFLLYLRASESNYVRYPISCDNTEWNKALTDWVDNTHDYLFVLDLLKHDPAYDFTEYRRNLNNILENANLTTDNVDKIVLSINSLDDDYPTFTSKSLSAFATTFSTMTTGHASYYYVWAILVANGKEPKPIDKSELSSLYEAMVSEICTTEDVVLKTIEMSSNSIYNLLKYAIANHKIHGKFDGGNNYLQHLSSIQALTGATFADIIAFFDAHGYNHLTEDDKRGDISKLLANIEWYKACSVSDTSLASSIIVYFSESLAKIDETKLITQNTHLIEVSNYWFKALEQLIGHQTFKNNLPQNVKNTVAKILPAIAEGRLTSIRDTMFEKLLDNVNNEDMSTSINDILVAFTNGKAVMNIAKFQMLHKWLEWGLVKFSTYQSPFLNTCLCKVLDDKTCRNIMLENEEFYRTLIQTHYKESSSVTQSLKKIQEDEKFSNEEFKAFADSIQFE